MPVIPDLHSFTAVTKTGFTITTVEAYSEIDARIKAADEMRVPPLKKYFDGWARDGYRMKDNGRVE
jgi:hypothetical protein